MCFRIVLLVYCITNVVQSQRNEIVLLSSTQTRIVNLCEVELFESDLITKIPLSNPRFTTRIGHFAESPPSNAVDGRLSTFHGDGECVHSFQPSGTSIPPSFYLDTPSLTNVTTPKYIRIFNREDCCRDRLVGTHLYLLSNDTLLIGSTVSENDVLKNPLLFCFNCNEFETDTIRLDASGLSDKLSFELCSIKLYDKYNREILIGRAYTSYSLKTNTSSQTRLVANALDDNFNRCTFVDDELFWAAEFLAAKVFKIKIVGKNLRGVQLFINNQVVAEITSESGVTLILDKEKDGGEDDEEKDEQISTTLIVIIVVVSNVFLVILAFGFYTYLKSPYYFSDFYENLFGY